MFISWAVTSYQSNGAKCDFSQGISVCLIEIPYPIRPACRRAALMRWGCRFAFAARLSAFLTLLAFLSNLQPFFRFALFLSLLHFVITPLVLLRMALFRLILSLSFFNSPSQLFSSFPSTVRKWNDCLSASLASALIDIAFCPSCSLLHVIRLTRINCRHTAVCVYE